MSILQLESKARHHWAKWLPEKVASLKAEGVLEIALRNAATMAQDRILSLMETGYRVTEAEEVALSEYILLPPTKDEEPDAEDLERLRQFNEANEAAEEAIRKYDLENPD